MERRAMRWRCSVSTDPGFLSQDIAGMSWLCDQTPCWSRAAAPKRSAKPTTFPEVDRGGAVEAGRRPPRGGALRARSVALDIVGCEARQGFVIAFGAGGSLRPVSIARRRWQVVPATRGAGKPMAGKPRD